MSNGSSGLLRSHADLRPSQRDPIDALLAEDCAANPWRPLVDVAVPARKTPQELAFASPADFLFYGGAAGGGKTDLVIGLALAAHNRSILFRCEVKQLHAVTDGICQILRKRESFNAQPNR